MLHLIVYVAFWIAVPSPQPKDCCEVYIVEKKNYYQYKIMNNRAEEVYLPDVYIIHNEIDSDTVVFEAYLKMGDYNAFVLPSFHKIKSQKALKGKTNGKMRSGDKYTILFRVFNREPLSYFKELYPEINLFDMSRGTFSKLEECCSYLVKAQKTDKM